MRKGIHKLEDIIKLKETIHCWLCQKSRHFIPTDYYYVSKAYLDDYVYN